jgi:hypothetical protein
MPRRNAERKVEWHGTQIIPIEAAPANDRPGDNMEIVAAYLAGILSAGALWFLVRWFETARDPDLEAVYRQRAEEDRMRRLRRKAEATRRGRG